MFCFLSLTTTSVQLWGPRNEDDGNRFLAILKPVTTVCCCCCCCCLNDDHH